LKFKYKALVTAAVSCTALLATSMTPADAATQRVIVGAGDSFTSGEGVRPYETGTDTATNTCHRSINSAYPKVAAYLLNNAQWRNVACSGATTADLFRTFKTEAAQADRLQGATDVVLTIGGNDINAVNLILNPPTPAQSDALANSLYPKLLDSYKKLKAKQPNAKIWAVTYPALYALNDSPGCVLSIERRKDAIYGQKALNNAILKAARDAGVRAVDAYSTTEGHELCTFQPYFNGYVPSDPEESFHPNAQGQAAIGWRVAATLKLAS
jgi:lysophospholipase L1-like esterase